MLRSMNFLGAQPLGLRCLTFNIHDSSARLFGTRVLGTWDSSAQTQVLGHLVLGTRVKGYSTLETQVIGYSTLGTRVLGHSVLKWSTLGLECSIVRHLGARHSKLGCSVIRHLGCLACRRKVLGSITHSMLGALGMLGSSTPFGAQGARELNWFGARGTQEWNPFGARDARELNPFSVVVSREHNSFNA